MMQSVRDPLAALIFFSLALAPGMSMGQSPAADRPGAKSHPSGRPAYSSAQLQGDQRIVHALNRFTFGPRPGDLEAVRTQGLDRWFEEQLHPAQIDQSTLNARLAAYPAMQWSSDELFRRMPSNAMIRQAMVGKAPVPESGILHAVYEDQMYRMAEKKQEKQDKAERAPTADVALSAPIMDAPKSLNSIDSDGNDMSAPAANNQASGIDPGLLIRTLALPPEQRIGRLVSMQPAEAEAFFKSLRGPDRNSLMAGMAPELKEALGALENPERTVVEELIAHRLMRDIYSNAQLEEVMTDFWLNHFNVYLRKNPATPYYLVSYERATIRPHALGKFEDLLESVAHSPAMLLYLDNASSTGPDSPAAKRAKLNEARNLNASKNREGLNENYARELMELHTLGVNGGYTQADVIQVARILTGWTVERPQGGGGFRFDPNRHEPGTKKVMGEKFRENGEREGRDLLHWLATRPATAHFISLKLAVRFVSDDPPAMLVDRMAATYMSSGGDISAVLKTLFHAPEFWSADAYRAKVKTPLEYVISAVRACDAEVNNLRPLANALREMGMPVYGAVPPTGYKWDAIEWVSTGALVSRMNFALALAANRLPGIAAAWSSSFPATTMQVEEARLESALMAGGVSQSTRAAVLQQSEAQSASAATGQSIDRAQPVQVAVGAGKQNAAPTPGERRDQLLAGLLLGSPEFQRR